MAGVKGKVAIITGAASGQGAAEARLFCEAGAKVIVADVNPDGEAVAAALDGNAMFVRHDVGDVQSWSSLMARTLERFGRLDTLVNNAGVYRPAELMDTSLEDWDLHYRVNQLGVFLGMRAAVEPMRATGGGAIINISSMAGLIAPPGNFAYGATKWAVRGMTAAAAVELAPLGIRVNGVYPGMIDTPMIAITGEERNAMIRQMLPMKRAGTPDEVAAVVLFLASDEASYVSGAEVKVGGG